MQILVAFFIGITFLSMKFWSSPMCQCTEAYHVFDSPPGLELPWAAQMPMDAPLSRVTMPPPVPGPALCSAPLGLRDAQNFSEAKRGISALAKEMTDWMGKMVLRVLDGFGTLWLWIAIIRNTYFSYWYFFFPIAPHFPIYTEALRKQSRCFLLPILGRWHSLMLQCHLALMMMSKQIAKPASQAPQGVVACSPRSASDRKSLASCRA